MSAWLVSKHHIDYMLSWVLDYNRANPGSPNQIGWFGERPLTEEDATDVGRSLVIENVTSVAYRYDRDTIDELPGPIDKKPLLTYSFEYVPGTTDAQARSCFACYDYQSCEHRTWPESRAYQFVCNALEYLPDSLRDQPTEWGI